MTGAGHRTPEATTCWGHAPPTGNPYPATVHADEMAEDFPVVGVESDAWPAVTLLAEHRLPGLVVTDPAGKPLSILPASQVVRILVPSYVQDDPSLAGVLSESMADRVADKLRGKTVRALLPDDGAGAGGGQRRRHDRRGRRRDGAAALPAGRGDARRGPGRRDHRVPAAAARTHAALGPPGVTAGWWR